MNLGFRSCTCLLIRQIYLSSKPKQLHNLILGVSKRSFVQYQSFQQRLTLPAISLVISQRTATKKGKKRQFSEEILKAFYLICNIQFYKYLNIFNVQRFFIKK